MKDKLVTFGWLLLLLLIIAVVVGVEYLRWNHFNNVMGTDVSYWQWRFFFDSKK